MPNRSICPFTCLCLLSWVAAGCANLSLVPPDQYNLTGQWQLNAAISDSPSLAGLFKSRQGAGGQRSRPQGGGRAGPPPDGGKAGGRGRGGQNPGGAMGVGARQPKIPSLQAKQIDIEQNVESMGLKFDGVNYTDVSWGKRKRGELTITSGWKDRDLIVKTAGGRIAIEERYVLSLDGQRLTLFVDLDGGRDDLSFKRVFEKIPAGTPN